MNFLLCKWFGESVVITNELENVGVEFGFVNGVRDRRSDECRCIPNDDFESFCKGYQTSRPIVTPRRPMVNAYNGIT